ncbi:MAG TPA: chemotaxis protein CheW [Blastocatellia bacterium]|nr:chemotaxis protein CheW [Blastocatellia bacterium]
MPEENGKIDWQEVQAKLSRARVRLERGFEPDAKAEQRILRARASALARESSVSVIAEDLIEVLEFRIAHETYAIETAFAREVYPLDVLTPVPCTPPFVLGIINVRGQILSVVDLRRFFALPFSGLSDLNKAIILHSPEMEFAVLADEIITVRTLPRDFVHAAPGNISGIGAKYVHGVTTEGLIILNAERILSDPYIVVREEIEL